MPDAPSDVTAVALTTLQIAACSLRQMSSSASLYTCLQRALTRQHGINGCPLWDAGVVFSSQVPLLSVRAEAARRRRWLDTRSAASEGTSLGALALPWTFAGQLAAATAASRVGKGAAPECLVMRSPMVVCSAWTQDFPGDVLSPGIIHDPVLP